MITDRGAQKAPPPAGELGQAGCLEKPGSLCGRLLRGTHTPSSPTGHQQGASLQEGAGGGSTTTGVHACECVYMWTRVCVYVSVCVCMSECV